MHAQDFVINYSGDWQAIEAVGENLPQLYGVSALAFIIEAVDAID